jgi:HSP20 family protein
MFSFPQPVDQEHVKASMKNGILSLSVPKAKKEQAQKKITIS